MTQEEKAKAYDEALEKAKRELQACGSSDCDAARQIFRFFPELQDSEDEKVRKSIIAIINNYVDNSNTFKPKMLAWLEKQGQQKYIPKYKIGDYVKNTNYKGEPIYEIIYMDKECYICEYRGKERMGDKAVMHFSFDNPYLRLVQKSDDKIEPKFHEGDWIISNNKKSTYQVMEVKRGIYVIRDNADNHEYHIGIEECERSGRLWNISDAKDGDVLFSDLMDGKTFIYNGVNSDMAILYSFIISNDGKDVLLYHIGKPNTGIGYIEEIKNFIYPATKEQRDLLFQKMKDTGYEWDAEKKELKMLEKQGKPKWTDEDEERLQSCIIALQGKGLMGGVDTMDSKWLKSLKQRMEEQQ